MTDRGSFRVQSQTLRDHAGFWDTKSGQADDAKAEIAPGVGMGDDFGYLAGLNNGADNYNTWTHEYVAFDVGHKGPVAAELTNEFLRCHFTNHTTDMEQRLIPTLLAAANHFRSRRIDIISGFRAPKYNLILRKKGRKEVMELSNTDPDERPIITAQWQGFMRQLETIGIPRDITLGWATWPAVVVRLRVTAVFEQTPGPLAGTPLA